MKCKNGNELKVGDFVQNETGKKPTRELGLVLNTHGKELSVLTLENGQPNVVTFQVFAKRIYLKHDELLPFMTYYMNALQEEFS